jgi:hypothetical protein
LLNNVPTIQEIENDHNDKRITETRVNKQATGLANINTKLVAEQALCCMT